MHIFLSYGHDEYLDFASRLELDLRQKGHEVWFDQKALKSGVDFEHYIAEGINWVSAKDGKFLILLTPHSVRFPDGYCLNELARAHSRHLTIIPVMVSTVEPPLSICRIQWLDFRDCIPPEQHEAKYAAQFEKLLGAIEHNQVDFGGVQARLQHFLQPIKYDEGSLHLPRFTGRGWVMKEIERWLASTRRVFWITGEAGAGKTALTTWLYERRAEIAGVHYCRHANSNRSNRKALLSLAYQLATQLPDYQNRLNDSDLEIISTEDNLRGLFERLFIEPLGSNFPAPKRSVVLLIDALDETTENSKNELAALIGAEWYRTPKWLRLIVTSRPHESEIINALQSLDPWMLDTGCRENQEDIQEYLRRELRLFAGNVESFNAAIEAILERSEGLFLYVTWIREELETGRFSLTNIQAFPRGLSGIYASFFQRYFPDLDNYEKDWRAVIEVICAAQQPISLDDLSFLFPAFSHPIKITRGLGSLFPNSDGGLRPFHKSIRDWLINPEQARDYVIEVRLGHQLLAAEGWRQYEDNSHLNLKKRMRAYYILHLPVHLSISNKKAELAKLLLDPEWIQAKLELTDVSRLLINYEYLKENSACTLVHDAIRLSGYVILKHPEELASQLVGRMLSYDYIPLIREFCSNISKIKPLRWLKPLHPALEPPGSPLLCTLKGHSDRVRGVSWVPNSNWAVSASDDCTLKIWDTKTGCILNTLKSHFDLVWDVSITPDGKRMVSASSDKTLRVWDLNTGRALRTLEGHSDGVLHIAITLDGKRVVSASYDKTLKVWDLDTGRILRTLEGHSNYVNGVAITPDGKRVVSASSDKTLRVWDLDTGRILRTLEGHSDYVNGVAITPDGKRVVSASWDRTLKVWNLGTGQLLQTLNGHFDTVSGVAIAPDGERVVSASWDGTLKVWQLDSKLKISKMQDRFEEISGLAITPDGKRIVSASWNGALKVWDLETWKILFTLQGHSDNVYDIGITPDGRKVISTSGTKTIKIWNVDTGRILHILEGHSSDDPNDFYDATISPDGKLVISRVYSDNGNNTLKVWNVDTGQLLYILEGHNDIVNDVAITPDSKQAISTSYDKTLKGWDLDTGNILHTLEGHTDWVNKVVITPDGKRAISTSYDKTLKVWDLCTGRLIRTLKRGHYGPVQNIVLTSDGKRAVTASSSGWIKEQDNRLIVWNLGNGCKQHILEGHFDEITNLIISPDGKQLASTSRDRTLKVWDLNTGLSTATFHYDFWVRCCKFVGESRILIGDERRVYILSIEESGASEL